MPGLLDRHDLLHGIDRSVADGTVLGHFVDNLAFLIVEIEHFVGARSALVRLHVHSFTFPQQKLYKSAETLFLIHETF